MVVALEWGERSRGRSVGSRRWSRGWGGLECSGVGLESRVELRRWMAVGVGVVAVEWG